MDGRSVSPGSPGALREIKGSDGGLPIDGRSVSPGSPGALREIDGNNRLGGLISESPEALGTL